METHSLHSAGMAAIGQKHRIEAGEMDRYLLLASCLKDADTLDRVRLGDLDVSRLRLRSGAELAPFAEALYRQYQRYPADG